MAGSSGQDRSLAVEDDTPSPEGARERLPCAKLTLGIDPRRTDSGVGGRLAEGFARQFGGQGRAGEGNREHRVRVKPRTIYAGEGTPQAREGLR